MPRAPRTCSETGCTADAVNGPRCTPHRPKATPHTRDHKRAYSSTGHARFRAAVLKRDPRCVICGAASTVADHYPHTRKELVAAGLNPNDPMRGRGLCASCHSRATALDPRTRGGWNARR
jgi:5-methylcytosine-specific restriction protein A